MCTCREPWTPGRSATPGSRGLAPAFRRRRCCLPPSQRCRLSPTRIFRGLPPRPAHPLSTLRRCPREHATQDSFPAAILILTGAGLSPAGRFRRFRFVALPLPPPGLPGARGIYSPAGPLPRHAAPVAHGSRPPRARSRRKWDLHPDQSATVPRAALTIWVSAMGPTRRDPLRALSAGSSRVNAAASKGRA